MSEISVIIPVYNSEDTIGACIESIQQQSMDDFELLIIDDGSTDQSGLICDCYAEKDNRLKVIHQQNKGRSEARYNGVIQATSKWVCFVDSDDQLPFSSLESLYKLTDEQTDIVLGNGHLLPATERREKIPMKDFRHLAVRAEGTIGVPWGSLYRRHLLTYWLFNVSRHIYNGEDYLFWLRLVFSTEKPVSVVYQSVYNKGSEHTSNCFTWTANYCYELNELRKQSIPLELHEYYMSDMLTDRIGNLFATAVWTERKQWINSRFYQDILDDLQKMNQSLSLKQRVFLSIPSRRLRAFIISHL